MTLFDTHAHLDEDAFRQDIDEVIARAVASGVTTMLAVATTVESSRATIALAARVPNVFASVGIHPNYAAQAADVNSEKLIGMLMEKTPADKKYVQPA